MLPPPPLSPLLLSRQDPVFLTKNPGHQMCLVGTDKRWAVHAAGCFFWEAECSEPGRECQDRPTLEVM